MKYINFNNYLKKIFLISVVFLLNGCDSVLLNPHGLVAIKERSLILTVFIIMLLVIVPVIFMTIYFSIKYKASNQNQIYKPNWSDSKKIEITVWTIPILIIFFLAFLSWNSSHELDPKKPIESKNSSIKIDVIALDWKWLFIYPEYNIATINEIVFPINHPVIFRITSNSVMNSFFIPSLGSQVYAMPGMTTQLNLISNYSGKYKGISSNYSGKGFSNMKFTVLCVSKNKEFMRWVKKIQNSNKKINTKKNFKIISDPSENNFIEYFSDVKKNLFDEIIHQFHDKTKKI
ncbi:ubiquinol oxidase subunit II [Buchnera aphidicola (Muscaphis stroyani)]|uniref:Ubiquinol oxidase subunit 2 n=1 Tax=Buchnera aphidicola (Muscaphis stroyani) TaxID=1241869 RepID=A0A4D6YFQ8_9GAMM|nr:ubiquinol oxidase subunit II [Buchnera aphidicola]QCI24510.1 ubiquinol oxidase subunit II [Buchnera aphidicola (Muscaphis stroyani)]